MSDDGSARGRLREAVTWSARRLVTILLIILVTLALLDLLGATLGAAEAALFIVLGGFDQ
ncbi:hypothetical protein AB0F46_13425 [Streptomyces sp. NPDC026665]|uniref:hypothetical protein n=1 Tax=Streptomyces sp. NPDC026665 TaxID=3154798 RepID=UPI0034075013